jgi:hypothetical protein
MYKYKLLKGRHSFGNKVFYPGDVFKSPHDLSNFKDKFLLIPQVESIESNTTTEESLSGGICSTTKEPPEVEQIPPREDLPIREQIPVSDTSDGLDTLRLEALRELAKAEGIELPNKYIKKAELIKIIREKI